VRVRVLLAGLLAISTAVIAGPASAKVESITEANIIGPGLEGGLRIAAPHTEGLWESGIDVAGGLDDTRADSVEELGLTPADLGPRYIVTYRFDHGDDLIRQDLYPYAKGGPVMHTPPGQELTLGGPARGLKIPMDAGWYQSSLGFLHYLVDRGLPGTNPVAPATGEPPSDIARWARMAPWVGIVVLLLGLAALFRATTRAGRPEGKGLLRHRGRASGSWSVGRKSSAPSGALRLQSRR